MKKNLIALAALAAGSAALAQSSVTLYGVADVAVGRLGKDGKTEMLGATTVNNTLSHLGVRGVEDLGGGLKAGFNFETGISLRNGATDAEESRGDAVDRTMWQRAANLWLGGGWGTFTMGRAYAPSYNAVSAWDIFGYANYSALTHSFAAVGEDRRNVSQLSYKTPNFGGFTAELGYVFKADNEGRAKVDVGLVYANGPLTAGLSYNKSKGRSANYAVGAQYRFGNYAVAAGYHASRNGPVFEPGTTQVVDNYSARDHGVSLGGRAMFGAFTVTLDVTRHTKSDYVLDGVRHNDKKYTNGTLAAQYALSKRTSTYAAYVRNWGQNYYGVGVQHRF